MALQDLVSSASPCGGRLISFAERLIFSTESQHLSRSLCTPHQSASHRQGSAVPLQNSSLPAAASIERRFLSEFAIDVEGFCKSYRSGQAVTNLSFRVRPGEILGLLGRNGAGKTTTLRSLAGIIPPTSGRMSIAGADVIRQSLQAKLQLAFIPDDPKVFDTLTVWEHLEFIASAYRVNNYHSRAVELLEQFSLTQKRDALAQELSRGMRQKLAIACGYLHDPAVLLFDEPLTGLDPHSIEQLQSSIRERAKAGAAIMISSHLLHLIENQCTHVLIIDQGRMLYHDSIENVRGLDSEADVSNQLQNLFFQLTREETDSF